MKTERQILNHQERLNLINNLLEDLQAGKLKNFFRYISLRREIEIQKAQEFASRLDHQQTSSVMLFVTLIDEMLQWKTSGSALVEEAQAIINDIQHEASIEKDFQEENNTGESNEVPDEEI